MTSTREYYRQLLSEQPVLPSPMCGISDFAFRSLCREFGGPMAYTQMVASEGVARGHQKTLEILDLHEPEPRLGMQVFGCDPQKLAESARKLESLGATVVDLNMGCPARNVTGSMGGSALLRRPELVREIFRAMRAALTVPFTVKMRWDWDDGSGAALEIGKIAEEEGLDGLCLHARTREQGYSGKADWEKIRQLKESVSIPVVGNGDVRSPQDAVAMIRQTGCDAVMIGRGAIGDPWLLRGAMAAIAGIGPTNFPDAASGEPTHADWESRREVMLRHAELMVRCKGMKRGLTEFRKHAVAYLRGVRGVRQLRQKMMAIADLGALANILDDPQEIEGGDAA